MLLFRGGLYPRPRFSFGRVTLQTLVELKVLVNIAQVILTSLFWKFTLLTTLQVVVVMHSSKQRRWLVSLAVFSIEIVLEWAVVVLWRLVVLVVTVEQVIVEWGSWVQEISVPLLIFFQNKVLGSFKELPKLVLVIFIQPYWTWAPVVDRGYFVLTFSCRDINEIRS